jgi:transporter family-2 protein
MKALIPYIFAISAGIFTALEVTINSRLGKAVTPRIATLHSLLIGMLLFLLLNLLKGTLHQYKHIFHVSPLWLFGGIFGALIIYLTTKTVPHLGVSTTLILVLSAEIITGLFIDSFVTKEQIFGTLKFIGLVFLLIGIYILIE